MKTTSAILTLLVTSFAVNAQSISIVPKPASVVAGQGSFTLDRKTTIHAPSAKSFAPVIAACRSGLKTFTGAAPATLKGKLSSSAKNVIDFRLLADSTFGAEGYRLTVDPKRITIESQTPAGAFYAVQSLLQLIPEPDKTTPGKFPLPAVAVADAPRFSWRGMHLDVSRHFFPKEFVKQYIDLLAMHKMNTFHWHLVDDQGWRIEIKKYPKLTQLGAWRVDRENIPEWSLREQQKPGETPTYGGFYTQADIREIVKYAAERFVTIVPEIEMPGHVRAALTAYPQFSCTGGPFTVPPGGYWPITDIYCAGNDSTFAFAQDILTEVISLFPGTYVHIGGDEADKTEWRKCPKCQARIKAEGLRNEAELQSYFTKRIEKFLVSKNRRLIGWDEILEGGLAPEATVMSWRGIAGGIDAARQGHHVVMTPTSTCYFDYYQGPPETEPLAIGGYVPVSAVYAYEPLPDSLTPEQAKYILGAQANLWTEYIPTPSHAEYMVLPRMAAMAEVVWTPKSSRSWPDFAGRLGSLMQRYEKMGVNYARSAYAVECGIAVDSVKKLASVTLSTEIPDQEIRYTLDGSDPTPSSPVYAGPFNLAKSATIRAAAFRNGKALTPANRKAVALHKAAFKPVRLKNRFVRYTGGGPGALTDAMQGGPFYADGRWQGFRQVDLEATVDMQDTAEVSRISIRFLENTLAWIFFPTSVEILTSTDDSVYASAAHFETTQPTALRSPDVREFAATLNAVRARFVRIVAKNVGICPDWHPGKGDPAWLFADEIVVE